MTAFIVAIGRWLTGPMFEVMNLPSGDATKVEESLKLEFCKRPLVVLDNVDSPASWLEDFACRVATGVRMSRRKLYTNSEQVHFTPRAGLIMTSRTPHFRREDVARRIIPMRFEIIPKERRRTETTMKAELDALRSQMWGDVLAVLGRVQDDWPRLKGQLKSSHSLADFSVFGAALHESDRDNWGMLMGRLEQGQRAFAAEDDPVLDMLAALLTEYSGTIRHQPSRELFQTLRRKAQVLGLTFPYTKCGAFTKATKARFRALEQALNADILISNNHQGRETWIEVQSKETPEPEKAGPTPEGDEGEDDSLNSLFVEEASMSTK